MSVKRGRNFLMAPGPTNIPERVLRAMQRPAVELSSPDFVALCLGCLADLKKVFRTDGRVFVYAANGHGAWEAALSNTLSPGDRVLAFETGVFSEAWARMAEALGAEAVLVPGDWRHGIDADAVEKHLEADRAHRIRAVLAIQTDTATGITSDVPAVRRAMDAAGHPALLMVDAVASLAATDFRMDEWGVDVAVGASQKALMSPPGLAFTAVNDKALARSDEAKVPRLYWDWRKRLDEEFYTWFCGTAPEHLLFALREALDMIAEEGLEAIFARHRRIGAAVRAAVAVWAQAGALSLNAARPAEQSDSVSTIRVDERWDAVEIRTLCQERLNVSLGGGLGKLKGRAFRIGHMGDINEPMILGALGGVETALRLCRVPHARGALNAAIESLAEERHPALAAR
ncbi:MAG: aminotransferase class V-fold PLP-dependent enzyme [Gammaproteobacteria bacterium]|nr:aminotransferase class V-fold PLP-dependent enzyme [Gammaproteobacteria bacterium]